MPAGGTPRNLHGLQHNHGQTMEMITVCMVPFIHFLALYLVARHVLIA